MQSTHDAVNNVSPQHAWVSEFSKKFSPTALHDLASFTCPASYPAGRILFAERDNPMGVYLVLEGEVKLSINSSDGRRLILRLAKKGEILGLASTFSGKLYDHGRDAVSLQAGAYWTCGVSGFPDAASRGLSNAQ